ncbi:MAG: hypothetical protein RR867_00675 [Ruthenibacterium sp.]
MNSTFVLWAIVLILIAVLAVLAVLVFAAARASRSKPRKGDPSVDAAQTPTQKTDNPYRKFYKK